MTDPNDRPIIGEERQSTGTFSVGAQDDGRYTYCFSNEMSSVTDKSVSFNVHGIVYIPEDSCKYSCVVIMVVDPFYTYM